jgi:hypothetical protein
MVDIGYEVIRNAVSPEITQQAARAIDGALPALNEESGQNSRFPRCATPSETNTCKYHKLDRLYGRHGDAEGFYQTCSTQVVFRTCITYFYAKLYPKNHVKDVTSVLRFNYCTWCLERAVLFAKVLFARGSHLTVPVPDWDLLLARGGFGGVPTSRLANRA